MLGKDKAFTYDSVYGEHAGQSSIFDDWVVGLVDGCFQGVFIRFALSVFRYFTLPPPPPTPRHSRLQRYSIRVWADRQR